MCKPKPGPRCSGHTSESLIKLSQQVGAAATEAAQSGDSSRLNDLTEKIAHTSYDHWGTSAGQDALMNDPTIDEQTRHARLMTGTIMRAARHVAQREAEQLTDPTERAAYADVAVAQMYAEADVWFAHATNATPTARLIADQKLSAANAAREDMAAKLGIDTTEAEQGRATRQCELCGRFAGGYAHYCHLAGQVDMGRWAAETAQQDATGTIAAGLYEAATPELAIYSRDEGTDDPATPDTETALRNRLAANYFAATELTPDQKDQVAQTRCDGAVKLCHALKGNEVSQRAALSYAFPAATSDQIHTITDAYKNYPTDPRSFERAVDAAANHRTDPPLGGPKCPGCDRINPTGAHMDRCAGNRRVRLAHTDAATRELLRDEPDMMLRGAYPAVALHRSDGGPNVQPIALHNLSEDAHRELEREQRIGAANGSASRLATERARAVGYILDAYPHNTAATRAGLRYMLPGANASQIGNVLSAHRQGGDQLQQAIMAIDNNRPDLAPQTVHPGGGTETPEPTPQPKPKPQAPSYRGATITAATGTVHYINVWDEPFCGRNTTGFETKGEGIATCRSCQKAGDAWMNAGYPADGGSPAHRA